MQPRRIRTILIATVILCLIVVGSTGLYFWLIGLEESTPSPSAVGEAATGFPISPPGLNGTETPNAGGNPTLPTETPPILTNPPPPLETIPVFSITPAVQSPAPPSSGVPQPLQGSGQIRLTSSSYSDYTPSLSPDQTMLAYASKVGNYWHIMIADPNGVESPHQITTGESNYYHPRFLPDQETMLVSSDLDGDLEIFLIDIENGEVIAQLTDNPGNDYAPYLLPDNTAFLFTSDRDGNDEIYLGYLDGRRPLRLTEHPGFDGYPSASSSGDMIGFYSNRDGNYDIYVMNIDKLNPQRLTNLPSRDADPVFSAGDQWIVFESDPNGYYDLYAIRTDGTGLTNLTNSPSNEYVPMFSPDQQWLLFQSDQNGNMDIYRIPWRLETGASLVTTPVVSQPTMEFQLNSIDGAGLVFIPAGEFYMGSDSSYDPYFWGAESPIHQVYLDDYWIYRTEVTNAMYERCASERACPKPDTTRSSTRSDYYGNPQYANYPVIFVSWRDALAYCQWAEGSLPSEAQWEKAARGTDDRLFPWGSTPHTGQQVNYCDASCTESWQDGTQNDGNADTAAVGSYPAGASPYGILDMAGNVWEWVFDWFAPTYYKNTAEQNPRGPASGERHVIRGGSWYTGVDGIRLVARASERPNTSLESLGFRCVVNEP